MVVIRKPKTSEETETLTLGAGILLQPVKARKIQAAKKEKSYFVEQFSVIRDHFKVADLTLVCDLSKEAAVKLSEIQSAFKRFGFIGTVDMGPSVPSKTVDKGSSRDKSQGGVL